MSEEEGVPKESSYMRRLREFEERVAAADTVEKVAVATFNCRPLCAREHALFHYIERVIEQGKPTTLEDFRNHMMALALMYGS